MIYHLLLCAICPIANKTNIIETHIVDKALISGVTIKRAME